MSLEPIKTHKILSLKDTETKTKLSRSTLYRLMGKGEFPKNIRISANRIAWLESDIHTWLENRIALSRPEHGGNNANK